MTDADMAALVARAAAGDSDAFTELVHGHHTLVFRWALIVAGDPDDADDLAQAVWIKAYRGLKGYRGEAKFTTWLYRITYNTAVEVGRKRHRQSAALAAMDEGEEVPLESASVHDELDQRRLMAVIRDMLSGLPPRQRAVFALADLDGVNTAEIADRLEIEEATVRVTLFKARRAIRSRLLLQEPKLMEEHRS
jgi:RNA polymerase sigma-70 factor (ECF subfamily)